MADDGLQSYLLNVLGSALDDEVNELIQDVLPTFDDIAKAAAQEGLDYLPVTVDYSKVNLAVLKLAQERAKFFATQSIDTSRAALNAIVANWIETGGTMADLIDRVGEVWEGSRPDVAAATEVTDLFASGNLAAWRESDVVEGYSVNTAEDANVDEICIEISQGGMYPLDDEEHKPPFHPNCRCWIVPEVKAVGTY